MKYLFSFIIAALLTVPSYAAQKEFELKVENNKIIHEDSDWDFLMHEHTYNFSMSKELNRLNKDDTVIHSFIQFDFDYNYASFNEPTHKIYTMGVLSCSRKAFMLLRQIYVKKDGEIQAVQPFRPNEYISEVEMPGTARNQMYLKICSGETI